MTSQYDEARVHLVSKIQEAEALVGGRGSERVDVGAARVVIEVYGTFRIVN